MFDSSNRPLIDVEEASEEEREARRETMREDAEMYMKLARIKSPWRRALLSVALDVLIFIGPLTEVFRSKREG